MKEKLCIALDVDSRQKAETLAKRLSPWAGMFKIGLQLFVAEGPKVIESVQNTGAKIFLDLKLHDIPNTVANAAKMAANMGVYMLNVHCAGGYNMLHVLNETLEQHAQKTGTVKPRLIGVTVLTSLSEDDLKADLLITETLPNYATHLARLCQRAGLDGVVCSPKELTLLRRACGDLFLLVAPGIRPSWQTGTDDQKRVTTPREAIHNGADYIVIGRPILDAPNPEAAAERILQEMREP